MARKAFAFLVLLLVSPAIISAATITVGDSNGWRFGVNYTAWARNQTFSPGDTLVFNYGASHSVAEVSQSDYDTCNSGNPVNSYPSSSPTSILLSTGTRYFICPTPGHCSQGIRLAVTVSGGSSGSAPSESPSNTPSPTSPPPAGNAATTLGGWSRLAIATSLALAAILAVMN